ncbi:MAG: tRNA 4-thiouridine(8) synthase ThiI [Candidatus Bathyarchaeota archaeon]|nr:MAG: tRNA 4-thiouridine(8) synthase ThiI [Candidatus Bathyarchaeota archaeon]
MQPAQTNTEKFERANFDSIIIRYGGELGIKRAWTRRVYERCLRENIKSVLKRYTIPYDRTIRKHGRLFLKTSFTTEASTKLARVFGISSLSPALETTSKLDDIVNKSVFLAGLTLHEGNSFAVRCRRVGHHSYTSTEVCREVGRQVLDAFTDRHITVNLKSPDATLGVEARNNQAFVYTAVIHGTGGLPLGTQSRVVGLLSGGLDSSVACWLVMKRGCPIVPLYFDNAPFTDESTTERVLNVARVLLDWAIGFPRRVYVVQHGPNLAEFKGKKRFEHLMCILCKRMMYRIAEKIVDMVRAEGIVTGEDIGEQASQTLRNLRLLDSAVAKYPVHRPLLGFDKIDTEQMARRIGTYEASIQKAKGCTAVSRKTVTVAKPREVAEAEKGLNIEGMVERSIKSLKIVNL